MYRDAVVVAPPPPPPPVSVAPIVTNAKGLIAQGNLIGAARAIVEGLKDNPKNSDLHWNDWADLPHRRRRGY